MSAAGQGEPRADALKTGQMKTCKKNAVKTPVAVAPACEPHRCVDVASGPRPGGTREACSGGKVAGMNDV